MVSILESDAVELRRTAVQSPLRITQLQCDGDAVLVSAYGAYLADLLDAQLVRIALDVADRREMMARAQQAAAASDLLLLGEPAPSLLARLLSWRGDRRLVFGVDAPILVARRPCWPLQFILLVVRGEAVDQTAVDWTERLAAASGALVTVLAVAPHAPAMYALGSPQVGVDVLLAPNTPSGRLLRRYLQQLANGDVVCELHLRQGDPDWQIRWELEAEAYDLVVIAEDEDGALARWMMGDLIAPLLRWTQRPLLVTKPATGGSDAGIN